MTFEIQDQSTFFEFLKGIDKNKETYKLVQSHFNIEGNLKKVRFNSIRYIENEDVIEFVLYLNNDYLVINSPFLYEEDV